MFVLIYEYSEDMISLLGKRPFIGRSDDMDKWLDENRGEKSAPPPLESPSPTEVDDPMPAPAPICAKIDDRFML
jgi:AFG3 family protein